MTTITNSNVSPELVDAFKGAMRRLASTVTIITARDNEKGHGMTATAVTSVTTTPPSILICVNNAASIHAPITESGRFCVNLLSCDHLDLVPVFSGAQKGQERFSTGAWSEDEDDAPYLSDAQANLFCRVTKTVGHGSHSIFIGEVEDVRMTGEVAPLLYQQGALFRSQALA